MFNGKSFFKKIDRMEVLLGSVIVSFIIIFFGFYRTYVQFESSDPRPQIGYYVPTVEKAGVPHAYMINVGLFIRSFPILDLVHNKFEMDSVIWFQFKPYRATLDMIDNFSFAMGTIKTKEKLETKMIGEEMFVKYAVRVVFQTSLDYKNFPFDDHYVSLVLTNKSVSPEEIRLVSKGTLFGKAEDLYTYDWRIVDDEVQYGVLLSKLDEGDDSKDVKSPAVVFTLSFEKSGVRKVLVLFIPLLVLFFLSLFSLLVSERPRAMALGALSTLLMFRFVIENMSPNVGYFTIVDKVYTFILVWAFLVFLLGMYFSYEQKKIGKKVPKKTLLMKSEEQINRVKRIFYVFSQIILLCVLYFIF